MKGKKKDIRVISKVRKLRVLVLGLCKRDDEHKKGTILKAKKTGATSKLLLNSGSKEFPLVSHFIFYDLSVIEANVFCENGPEPNQFVRKV